MQYSWFSPILQTSLEKKRKRRGIQGKGRTQVRCRSCATGLAHTVPACNEAMVGLDWDAAPQTSETQIPLIPYNKKTKHNMVCSISSVQRRALATWICSRSLLHSKGDVAALGAKPRCSSLEGCKGQLDLLLLEGNKARCPHMLQHTLPLMAAL